MNHSNPRLTAFRKMVALRGLTDPEQFRDALAGSDLPLLRDIALESKSSAMTSGDIGLSEGLDELLSSYLSTRQTFSVVDALVRMAPPLPTGTGKVVLAGGAAASTVGEGASKVSTKVALNVADAPVVKVASLVVVTREFLGSGTAAETLVVNQMGVGLDSAANAAIVDAFADPVALTSSGDAEADLKAAIGASQSSSAGYVVLASPGVAAALALSDKAGPGMSVVGGEYVPGVFVVSDDALAEGMVVIPAGRVKIQDDGLFLRRSEQDAVQMTDAPINASAPTPTATQMVSLFQTNSVALLLERRWRLMVQDAVVVTVGVGS